MAKTNNKMSNKTTTESVSSKSSVPEIQVAASPVDVVKPVSKRASSSRSSVAKDKVEMVIPPLDTAQTQPVAVSVQPAVPVQPVELEAADSSILVKLSMFGAKLHQLTSLLSSVKTDYKQLEKMVARELKNAHKTSRRKKSSGNRQPSGFVKPTLISDELAHFLNKNVGTEMARTDVSKEINAYIRAQGLQDKANGRRIIADAKLARLLKLGANDELTYFNLQRYMKHHFVKTEPVVSVSAGVSV